MFYPKTSLRERTVVSVSMLRQVTIALTLSALIFLTAHQLTAHRQADLYSYIRSPYPERPTTEAPAKTTVNTSQPCLPYILYDKPVKTGSTALSYALHKYIEENNEESAGCTGQFTCEAVAKEICAGILPPAHLVNHIHINASTSACLREKGFYYVTSVREPKERVLSAWKYSRMQRRSFYGISYNATLEEWLNRFPRCSLYKYYDLLPSRCTREQALKRAEEIANRYDEVIDLSDDIVGDVHRRIDKFLEQVNVSKGQNVPSGSVLQVPDEVVQLEYLLYNKLRKKRKSLSERRSGRVLCPRYLDSVSSSR